MTDGRSRAATVLALLAVCFVAFFLGAGARRGDEGEVGEVPRLAGVVDEGLHVWVVGGDPEGDLCAEGRGCGAGVGGRHG